MAVLVMRLDVIRTQNNPVQWDLTRENSCLSFLTSQQPAEFYYLRQIQHNSLKTDELSDEGKQQQKIPAQLGAGREGWICWKLFRQEKFNPVFYFITWLCWFLTSNKDVSLSPVSTSRASRGHNRDSWHQVPGAFSSWLIF